MVYVAGPYRADTENGVFENIMRAREHALKLWKQGYAVVCPHLNTMFMGGACPDEVWLERDLEILERCDLISMVPGWELSSGARNERTRAAELGMGEVVVTQTIAPPYFQSRVQAIE